jgi:uncharacterized protein YcbK (DUF882 family)
MMRTKARVALLFALACLQICGAPMLAARPTRSLARRSEGRLIVAQPTQRLSRRHSAHLRANSRLGTHAGAHSGARASAAELRVALNLSRYAGPTAPHSISTHRSSIQPPISNPDADQVHSWIRSHAPQQRSLDAQISNSTSTGGEPIPDSSSTLINVDGTLRPLTDAHPLPSIEQEAATPLILPALRVSALYDSRGHLMVPQPLYGTHDILIHQNQMADRDGLDRVRDDADLLSLRRLHKLVALPENEALRVDDRLPEDRRFTRPWTAAFLAALARDHYDNFRTSLQVNSAVRTVEFQQHLERSNPNAAPSNGDTASPHLTGQAIDIAKHGLSLTEIAWMRAYLQPLIEQGKIDVEEEFQQACFHISVYKSYAPAPPSRVTVATAH